MSDAVGTGGNGHTPAGFRGVAQLALDAKGRLADSGAASRRARATAAAGASSSPPTRASCLLLYPLAAWEPIQARLMGLSSFNERIRGLQRLLVGHADDVEMDGAGRILVPPALRDTRSSTSTSVLVGQGKKFELWNKTQWAGADRAGDRVPARAACRPSSKASRLVSR